LSIAGYEQGESTVGEHERAELCHPEGCSTRRRATVVPSGGCSTILLVPEGTLTESHPRPGGEESYSVIFVQIGPVGAQGDDERCCLMITGDGRERDKTGETREMAMMDDLVLVWPRAGGDRKLTWTNADGLRDLTRLLIPKGRVATWGAKRADSVLVIGRRGSIA